MRSPAFEREWIEWTCPAQGELDSPSLEQVL